MNDKFIQNIGIALEELFNAAENHNKDCLDLNSSLAEVTIKGVVYQIQLSLIANPKLWTKENGVRYSEVVKIHNN
jgi:outer membrane usher protein FimD/PapC